jgi:hypothetical protein
MPRTIAATLAMFLLGSAACSSDKTPGASAIGPRTFLFGTRGLSPEEGEFVAVTSDPMVQARLDAELALPEAQRGKHISGIVAKGNGGVNLSWSWHFVPDEWDVVDLSIEICDGTPSAVEANVDAWAGRTFCPWSSYVEREL